MNIKNYCAIFVCICSLLNIYLYWGSVGTVLAWIVAFTGWIDHCFPEEIEHASQS
jgi:hypothetical protein